MKKLISILAAVLTLAACDDGEHFTTSSSARLSFSQDTINLDTTFTNLPTSEKDFWAFNILDDGIRITSVRLERGNQTGFQVNVDGTFLGPNSGYAANDFEVRSNDSLRVFVKLNAPTNHGATPQQLDDNIVFTLDNGTQQRVALRAYAWDATILRGLHVAADTTLSGQTPIVISGDLTVDSAATLTIAAGTTLYFQPGAGLHIHGRLLCKGEAGNEVTLRGARLDRMFDYLPYDNVSGQWNGIHIYASSYGNQLTYTDVHSTYDGIVCDSSDCTRSKLTLKASTIHNCQGYGLKSTCCNVKLVNSQLTNTLNDCLLVDGGVADVNACTLAQFYPFDATRGAALAFSSLENSIQLACRNTLVTGYADDVINGSLGEDSTVTSYLFDHCILRTPNPDGDTADNTDSIAFVNTGNGHFISTLFENVEDTTHTGKKHFTLIDEDNLRYDFSLDSLSTAIGMADDTTVPPLDRDGLPRSTLPAIGAFEYRQK